MYNEISPFNIELLILTKDKLHLIKEVSNLNIFVSSSRDFDPKGLFSTEVFGRVGTEERNYQFGYIDMHVKVFHPVIYTHLVALKKMYADIISGKKYAEWDDKLKDFVPSNIDKGETGFNFFVSHYDDIQFVNTNSDERDYRIKLLKKYKKDEIMLDKFLVLPAGLRDYTIDDNGKPSEDEVNTLYRKLLITSNMLINLNIKDQTASSVDAVRNRLQMIVLSLYDHFVAMLDGKKKFILGKWTKRAVRETTRNVITPTPMKVNDLEDMSSQISFNNTSIGLYQYIKGIPLITKYQLKNKVLNRVFDPTSSVANLVDVKTKTTVSVTIKSKTYTNWMSDEGINGVLNKLAQEEIRSDIVYVENYYLILLYDDGENVKFVYNTEEMPEEFNKKYLRPITYGELFYLCVYKDSGKYPGFLTRYPVSGLGSIYPSIPYLKTTVPARRENVLGDDWEVDSRANEYPIPNKNYVNSLSPHITKLKRLAGDYDGDKCSYLILDTTESIEEIHKLFKSRSFYVTPSNELTHSTANNVLDILTKTLTSD